MLSYVIINLLHSFPDPITIFFYSNICRMHCQLITMTLFQGKISIALSRWAYLLFIEDAIAMKACSTLVAFFALVSMNGMPISSANAYTISTQNKCFNDKSSYQLVPS